MIEIINQKFALNTVNTVPKGGKTRMPTATTVVFCKVGGSHQYLRIVPRNPEGMEGLKVKRENYL